MKKKSLVIGLLLAFALAMTACGGNDQPASNTENANTEAANSEIIVDTNTEVSIQEPIDETTIPEGMVVSDLTGEFIDADIANQRPVAVMVDNEKTALPHYGLTKADIIYEMVNSEANDRVTRLMVMVKDWEAIEQLGNVRSARATNCMLAMEWNAILCHDGGPFYINDYIVLPSLDNLSGGFSRIPNGKAYEFTEYISEGEVAKRLDANNIETEYNNFEAVNIPKSHPARDMQDTFYLDNGQLLKTHTSASQNRIMKKYGAPLRVIFPGRYYRNEELDASHENTFFQLEGMMIDEDVSISNLIYFMKTMLTEIFQKEINVRLRPGFFPFTEPSFELDISCPYCGGKGCKVCKQGGWIELCPCGMIHPNVLKMGGIDTEKYKGFAFGLGLSRLAMMNYDITEIRLLNSGNIKALKQAKIK